MEKVRLFYCTYGKCCQQPRAFFHSKGSSEKSEKSGEMLLSRYYYFVSLPCISGGGEFSHNGGRRIISRTVS